MISFIVGVMIDILLGAIAGWFAGKIMNSKRGFWGCAFRGIIGGIVGGIVLGVFGIHGSGILGSIIVSIIGACLIIWLDRKLSI